jgi:hypothetical protein
VPNPKELRVSTVRLDPAVASLAPRELLRVGTPTT